MHPAREGKDQHAVFSEFEQREYSGCKQYQEKQQRMRVVPPAQRHVVAQTEGRADSSVWLNAVVDLEGVQRECNVAFIDDPQVGDYVLMHAGFAMKKWSEEDVQELKRILAYDGFAAAEQEPKESP